MKRIIIIILFVMLAVPASALVLKEDTATTVTIGPFVDSTDGATAEAALTLSQADIQLSKNGAAFAQKNQASNATYGVAGMYRVPLDATDTNTPGVLTIAVAESGALIVMGQFQIVAANTYDSLYSTAAADLLDVNASQVGGTAQTGRDIGASVLLSPGTGTGQISLASGAVTVGTNNDKTSYALSGTQTFNTTGNITGNLSGSVGSVTGAAGSVTGAVGSVTGAVGSVTGNVGGNVTGSVGSVVGDTKQTGDAYARLGAPAGASVSADLAAIEGQTDDIGVAGAGLSAVPWNAAWDAEVQSEVTDALTDFFTSAATLATTVWAAATRTLTALDEDSTTMDLNGTAVGSVTTGSDASAANQTLILELLQGR